MILSNLWSPEEAEQCSRNSPPRRDIPLTLTNPHRNEKSRQSTFSLAGFIASGESSLLCPSVVVVGHGLFDSKCVNQATETRNLLVSLFDGLKAYETKAWACNMPCPKRKKKLLSRVHGHSYVTLLSGGKKNTSFKRIQQQQKKMEAAAFWMPIQRWYLEIHPGSHHFISKVSQENHPCFNHPNLWQDFDVQKAAAQ